MKALVVYDSVFGNTEKIAQAIAEALRPSGDVEVHRVSDVTPDQLTGLSLLIVGSPTRAFSPTPAIKNLVRSIPAGTLRDAKVAGFDTRISVDDTGPAVLRLLARLFGYAAKPISVGLEKKGGQPAAAAEGFYVTGSEGPLAEGELERAVAWAQQIVAAL